MKKVMLLIAVSFVLCQIASAEIKWIDSYSRQDGTIVSGHYRDTSNDGNKYNNANYLGYNN